MTSSRNMRRLGKKGSVASLAAAFQGLEEVTSGLRAVIPGAERDLTAAQEFLQEFRGGLEVFHYRLERQRAVFIRLLNNAVVGGDVQELLTVEAEYEAEFDAMRFLCWVATLAEDS